MSKPSVILYTDGGCSGNPGPGGYGVVLKFGNHRRELSGGFRKTTNNRMEILSVIKGLEVLKEPCKVTVFSDSQYVVNAISKGWARKWEANGWMRNKKEKALNPDLWEQLLDLCDEHDITFQWIRGHDGNIENERCDQLCKASFSKADLPPDSQYEKNNV